MSQTLESDFQGLSDRRLFLFWPFTNNHLIRCVRRASQTLVWHLSIQHVMWDVPKLIIKSTESWCLQMRSSPLHPLLPAPCYYVLPLQATSPALTIHLVFSIPSAGASFPLLGKMSVRKVQWERIWTGWCDRQWRDEDRWETEGGRATVQYSVVGEVGMGETKAEMGERGRVGERTRKMVCGCQATIDNQIPKHTCAALPSLQV